MQTRATCSDNGGPTDRGERGVAAKRCAYFPRLSCKCEVRSTATCYKHGYAILAGTLYGMIALAVRVRFVRPLAVVHIDAP